MNATTYPGNPLRGEAKLPGDKSLSHRSALFASLAEGNSCIQNYLVAGVTEVLLANLAASGIRYDLEGDSLDVSGEGLSGYRSPAEALDCGNSATTMRLLAGALAAAGVPAVLDGSAGLRRRPMGHLVEALRAMQVPIEATDGRAPLYLGPRPSGRLLQARELRLPVASAQIKSAVLLAALAADGPTTVIEPGPSRDHTEKMLSSMGVELEVAPSGAGSKITLQPLRSHSLEPINRSLPGDISSAAFLIVAALTTPGSEVVLREVGLNPTRTGLLEVLREMGADFQIANQREVYGEAVGDLLVRYSRLRGTQVSGHLVVRMIDEFPALAIAASYAQSPTRVSQASALRDKESDRIADLCNELRALSVEASDTADGFIISGGKNPEGGLAEAHGDHRLAMALMVAGLSARSPVTVQGAEMARESFPGFIETLVGLGADISVDE